MKYLIACLCCLSWSVSQAQQLHVATWLAGNRTAYQTDNYRLAESFASYGGRLVFGHPNFQIGAEYETNLTNPAFEVSDETGALIRKDEFEQTWYGVVFRINTARVPVYRTGLIFKFGGGLYDTHARFFDLPDNRPLGEATWSGKFLGINAGVGFSIPLYRIIHWEVQYQFNYAQIPAPDNSPVPLSEFTGIHHSFQTGISLNFVFGEAARRAKEVLRSREKIH